MKNKKYILYLLSTLLGALLFYIGEFVLVTVKMKSLSGLCIGLGAAVFCLGIGNFISSLVLSKTTDEETLRRKRIEVNDERNTIIREKVGAKINLYVNYALSIILLAFGFLQVPLIAILMLASVFLLELVLAIVLTDHYSKRI